MLWLSCQIMSNSFAIPGTIAHLAPLSTGFPRQELEWLAISSSRGSSPPRNQTPISTSPALQDFFTTEPSGKPFSKCYRPEIEIMDHIFFFLLRRICIFPRCYLGMLLFNFITYIYQLKTAMKVTLELSTT